MARSRKFYEPKVDEAIFTLLGAGCRDKDILRMLAQDEAGIGYPVSMPERTYYDHKRKLLDARGKPELYPQPGRELDLIEELSRRTLALISREIERLEGKAKENGGLTTGETAQLKSAQRFVNECRRARRDEVEAKHTAKSKAGRISTSKTQAQPVTMLERLSDRAREVVPEMTQAEALDTARDWLERDEVKDEGRSNFGNFGAHERVSRELIPA